MTVLWQTVERVRSGVFHIVCFNQHGERIGSGTGFASRGRLITNNHVFAVPSGTTQIWIRQDGYEDKETQGVLLEAREFYNTLVAASPPDLHDYAVLDVPALNLDGKYQFDLIDHKHYHIGQTVAFLGFPLEHQNLTCHTGIVSSFYKTNGVCIIQIDASVNPSNSGGPLFDPCSGEVIGIITRNATGLIPKLFSELRTGMEEIIESTRQIHEFMEIGGYSVKRALLTSQESILRTLGQIERSANVGIGYAFSTRHLLEDAQFTHPLV